MNGDQSPRIRDAGASGGVILSASNRFRSAVSVLPGLDHLLELVEGVALIWEPVAQTVVESPHRRSFTLAGGPGCYRTGVLAATGSLPICGLANRALPGLVRSFFGPYRAKNPRSE